MRVTSITHDESARVLLTDALSRHIVKARGHAVGHFIDRPPRDALHIQRVRMQDGIGTANDFLKTGFANFACIVLIEVAKIHIQT